MGPIGPFWKLKNQRKIENQKERTHSNFERRSSRSFQHILSKSKVHTIHSPHVNECHHNAKYSFPKHAQLILKQWSNARAASPACALQHVNESRFYTYLSLGPKSWCLFILHLMIFADIQALAKKASRKRQESDWPHLQHTMDVGLSAPVCLLFLYYFRVYVGMVAILPQL